MSQQREAIDTYLMRVLHTLLTEGSVTRTAVKLNQSQPAISAALRRLRDITGDPLLVRGKTGMVPTEYGLRLLEPVQNALGEIERIKYQQRNFNPATSIRTFRIACPDYLNVLFVPTVVECFRCAAPKAKLEFHSLGPAFDYEMELENGKLDIVIGNWPEPPEQLHLSNLFVDQIVCLMSTSHPFVKRDELTLDAYLHAPHLAPTPYSVGQRGAIDVHLARERLKRQVVVTLPYFNVAPYVLIKSDLIFTTTRLFADYYARFLPLTVMPAPIDFPPMQYYQLWHERVHYSDEVRWLRGLITEATKTLVSRPVSPRSIKRQQPAAATT
ncbi:LysR substrate-binding domain-containing protein [Paraburkholderia bonniea]|uniref:LysR substrate-binding domain-containing protein n=1 Tax=Paraburkholderia bonniea TaxID=2152891 RepID=UPI0012926247|nr:LysR substrate-binding domain-containing protein [Paraburkholderia bonniea]WJF89139.1 LysR substrate-binding domain-containing protein [Paraburkholderia bonniea]WJF92455.1 LysR substrate-binding domain-containing protein [Paraburkholderia bonniea]